MTRMLGCCMLILAVAGCANRPGWGFRGAQGTIDRQKARAVVHDPFPLNDIGPEVIGGRPREFYNPQPEATRQQLTDQRAQGYYSQPGY